MFGGGTLGERCLSSMKPHLCPASVVQASRHQHRMQVIVEIIGNASCSTLLQVAVSANVEGHFCFSCVRFSLVQDCQPLKCSNPLAKKNHDLSLEALVSQY